LEDNTVLHPKWWWKPLWKLKAPPRCKLTLWLALNKFFLTWDNSLRRGWCGPNRCPLCKGNQESITHLFISCSYAEKVVNILKEQLKAKANWNQGSVEDCFRTWIQDRSISLYAGLLGIMISNIWWARNNVVFKDKLVPPEVTMTISLSQAKEFKAKIRASKTRTMIPPLIDYTIPWGFFNGASQGHPPTYGVGVVLYISHSHYIHIRYMPGGRTNNREKLIALWTLLETTKEIFFPKLQVFGDSKLVIDWARGINNIQNPRLASLLRDIKLTFKDFEWLTFQHILRELNSKADELSKEAL
jgi:ribonuclease HI